MRRLIIALHLLFLILVSMPFAWAHCTDLKQPSGITGYCALKYIEDEYKKCQDQAESKNSFCTNPDQAVEAALHIQFVADQKQCQNKAKSDQSNAQRGFHPAEKVVLSEGCHCLKEGLANYDAREMARNLKLSGTMNALFPTLSAPTQVDINTTNLITGFHSGSSSTPKSAPIIKCPELMEELAYRKAVADGNVLYGLALSAAESERLLSLAFSLSPMSLTLLHAAVYGSFNLSLKPFQFDKWKYFDDQSEQYAQCGKKGFLRSGTKCQNIPPMISTVQAGFGSTSDIFCDNQGSCQDLTRIPKQTRLVFSSIHMTFPITGNIFGLKLGPNRGIQSLENVVRLDNGGITTLDVSYPEGQIVTDLNSNVLWTLLGSTTYYGSGTDVYETNTAIWDLSSAVLAVTTNQEDDGTVAKPSAKLTGMQAYAPPFFTTGVTFNHYYLANFRNALDIARVADGFSILSRGNADLAIFGFGGYFPFLTRQVFKGDSVIVKNQNISVVTGYVTDDKTYSYLMYPYNGITRVMTKEGKIIEESGQFPRYLSNRQKALVFLEGYEYLQTKKEDLVFE